MDLSLCGAALISHNEVFSSSKLFRINCPRFAHFSPNLLKSLDGSFAKLVTYPRQFIDFKGLKKMAEPRVLRCHGLRQTLSRISIPLAIEALIITPKISACKALFFSILQAVPGFRTYPEHTP
jgi:hypothetical protein